MNTAITLHLSGKDAIRAEHGSVVIESEDGSWITLRPEDVTTARRLEAVVAVLRERMAAEKVQRVALLERVEGAA